LQEAQAIKRIYCGIYNILASYLAMDVETRKSMSFGRIMKIRI
jgi:hypothetical protein